MTGDPVIRRGAAAVLAIAAGGAALGACSSGTTTAPTSTTSSLLTVPLPTLPGTQVDPAGRQYLIVDGRTVVLPFEQGRRSISPVVDDGQQVIITSEGMWPHQLFAQIGKITFTNVTAKPETVVFEHSTVRSPVIAAAGGTWSWTSKTLISYAYHDSSGQSGVLIVGATP